MGFRRMNSRPVPRLPTPTPPRLRLVLVGSRAIAPVALRAVEVVDFARLTPALLDRLRPAALGFALFAEGHEAFQVLGRLERLGYRGRVLALAPPLPARRMVERELRAQAPGLRVRVVCLAELAQ